MVEQAKQTKQEYRLVRIMSKDIEGKMSIYAGLTKIKGVSWSFSNLVCKKLKIDKKKTIGSLTDDEIKKITEFIKNPDAPKFILNRRFDIETGEDRHLASSDLDLQKEFDIKRLKKVKSYRGIRHASNLPVRGQRTKGHFRKNRKKSGGIKKKVTKNN
jgi:small subunit ribosomal protein S13